MGASLPFMATDSKTEHPDWQRLTDVIEEIQQAKDTSILASLDGWVDVETMEQLVTNFIGALRNKAKTGTDVMYLAMFMDPMAVKTFGETFVHGFLMGAQFQAAGGHRDDTGR
jgi:hypothetical protein